MDRKLYRRDQLPQWYIHDVIKHDYSFYFGLHLASCLIPSQRPEDYDNDRVRRKLGLMEVGQFDPIITDCDFNIICGHHRHKMLKDFYTHSFQVPIICLEGATIQMVVEYYESLQLHEQAQLDYQAEMRAVEDYDYMKLKEGKAVI